VTSPPSDPAAEVDKVLRSFFSAGVLVSMPRPGRKRRIVLEHIAQLFEPGRRYDEVDVNLALRQVWPRDVAAVRRYLVDERLLDRADGAYWRIGGPVDV
jgi:hypothetical protein